MLCFLLGSSTVMELMSISNAVMFEAALTKRLTISVSFGTADVVNSRSMLLIIDPLL